MRTQITEPIDDFKLFTLCGNTHPLATPANDRGPVPDITPMNDVWLLLKRRPGQSIRTVPGRAAEPEVAELSQVAHDKADGRPVWPVAGRYPAAGSRRFNGQP